MELWFSDCNRGLTLGAKLNDYSCRYNEIAVEVKEVVKVPGRYR